MAKQATAGIANLSTDQLKQDLKKLAGAVGNRAVSAVGDRLSSLTGRLVEYAEKQGGGAMVAAAGAKLAGKSPVKAGLGAKVRQGMQKVKEKFGGGGGGQAGGDLKVTNIIEKIDVGVPVHVAYNQWTQFEDFPTFMKKVENVKQESDEKLTWKAQIFWSHRTWTSTIIEQVPDKRIVWRSEAEKGYVDGAVTFHELAPDLTRILLVLEYHPKGFFEQTANLWRAQGRRVRLELKHFARHVMTKAILHPDEVKGWRGEIHDEQVTAQPEAKEGKEGEEEKPAKPEEGEERAEAEEEPEEVEKAEARKEGGEGEEGAQRGEAEQPRRVRPSPKEAEQEEPEQEAEVSRPVRRRAA